MKKIKIFKNTEIWKLKMEIKEKEEELRKLKLVKLYKEKVVNGVVVGGGCCDEWW